MTSTAHPASSPPPLFVRAGALVVAAALALAALLVPATPALADTAAEKVTTFGIRPGTATGPDAARTFFSITAAPGATVTERVYVTNFSKETLTLGTYAADAYNNPDGGYNVLLGSQPSHDLGAWIALPVSKVTLAPGKGQVVPFRVTLPPNASVGDHAAGVVVSLKRPQVVRGTRVIVEQRVGVRVYLRVPGDLKPALTVQNFTVRYGGTYNPLGGDVVVEYDVANSGNVRLSAQQNATVAVPLLGTRKGDVLPLRDLLPGSRAHVRVAFVDVPPLGPLSTRVSVDPVAAAGLEDPGVPSVVNTVTPWGLFWLVLVVVSLLATGIRVLLGRRGERGAAPPPPPVRQPAVPVA